MKRLFVIAVLFISASLYSFASPKADKKEKAEHEVAVKSAIDSRRYEIRVNMALPAGGRSVSLSSPYDVKIAGDSVICHLPYFGRAYSIPYGGGEGLIFTTTTEDYKLEYGKRGVTKISFSARTKEDMYMFAIEIHTNGSSSVWVQPNNKQSITFIGEMVIGNKKK